MPLSIRSPTGLSSLALNRYAHRVLHPFHCSINFHRFHRHRSFSTRCAFTNSVDESALRAYAGSPSIAGKCNEALQRDSLCSQAQRVQILLAVHLEGNGIRRLGLALLDKRLFGDPRIALGHLGGEHSLANRLAMPQ